MLCYRNAVSSVHQVVVPLLLGAALAACQPRIEGAEGPSETLRAYAAALQQGKADEAYRLLSDEAKRSVSLEAYRRLVKDNPEDVKEIALALSRPGSTPVVSATVHTPAGDKLRLLYEAGRWTVDGSGIDRYGQGTPRQALLGFLRAFERKRFDVLVRYMPDAEREGRAEAMWGSGASKGDGLTAKQLEEAWTGDQLEQISGIVQAIKSALPTARLEETADRAAMAYGAGGSVLFVRENGLWKIEDLK